MSDGRLARIGRNEALYRHVNDQIEEVNRSFSSISGGFAVTCECGELDCMEQIAVSIGIYERTRGNSARFIVVPGHEIGDVEMVVETYDEFVVVEKTRAEAIRLAAQTDSRS